MKKSGLKIYLFRHGQTTYNRDNLFTGFKDAKLTPTGIDDARIIALRLYDKKFQAAFYTKLSRSKDTLKEVIKSHPECKLLVEDNRMIERSYGNLEGKFHSTIIKKYGKQICIADENAGELIGKRYCTLIFLKDVRSIEPFFVSKEGYGNMCAWISVDDINKLRSASRI